MLDKHNKMSRAIPLLCGLLLLAELCLLLGRRSLLLPLAGGLGLCTLGVHLVLDVLLSGCLSLGLVNLNKA